MLSFVNSTKKLRKVSVVSCRGSIGEERADLRSFLMGDCNIWSTLDGSKLFFRMEIYDQYYSCILAIAKSGRHFPAAVVSLVQKV